MSIAPFPLFVKIRRAVSTALFNYYTERPVFPVISPLELGQQCNTLHPNVSNVSTITECDIQAPQASFFILPDIHINCVKKIN